MKSLLFLLVIPFLVRSQSTGYNEGFIVKNNNDTVHGLIKNNEYFPHRVLTDIKFKRDEQDSIELLSPDELKGFQIGKAKYESKYLSIKKKKYFFELIINGFLSYYEMEYRNWGVNNYSSYVIFQKQNDEELFTFEVMNPFFAFRRKAVEYLKEDPDLCKKIRTGIYDQRHLKTIVREYNSFIQANRVQE